METQNGQGLAAFQLDDLHGGPLDLESISLSGRVADSNNFRMTEEPTALYLSHQRALWNGLSMREPLRALEASFVERGEAHERRQQQVTWSIKHSASQHCIVDTYTIGTVMSPRVIPIAVYFNKPTLYSTFANWVVEQPQYDEAPRF